MQTEQITAGTIARTLCLALALFNQVLTMTGHAVLPIDDETINQAVTLAFTIGASVVAWWKNNSFTDAAIRGDAVTQAIKRGAKETNK